MSQYPIWKYHRTKEARIVRSAEEMATLGDGWADSPAVFEKIPFMVGEERPLKEAEKAKSKGKAKA